MNTPKKTILPKIKELTERTKEQWLKDYCTFLSYPSVSSEPEFKQQVLDCADWVSGYLKKMGFAVEFWPTTGHPVIFASYMKAGPDKPTLLIYNHYDVQPTDPLEAWQTPPFQPTQKNGEIYARGANDNKGQCFYVMQALKQYLQIAGSLPLNIKLCIEGEEEMGSAGLSEILKKKQDALKADYLAIVDLGLRDPNAPAVTLGIRGLTTLEVELRGSGVDLHSGTHGGIVTNPIHALVSLLASVRDEKGRITIPGFYDDVVEMPIEERTSLSFTFDPTGYTKITGALATGGEKEFSAWERAWIRPTLEVNGISGGYTGVGFKTVIPAIAKAKISCRLVPNQDPQKIGELVANHLRQNVPTGMTISVQVRPGGGKAVRTNPNANVVKAFARAFEDVYGVPCEFIMEGGSIPIVTELAAVSQAEVVLVGLGLTTDLVHAPNEHFGLDRIEKGILIMSRAFELLSE